MGENVVTVDSPEFRLVSPKASLSGLWEVQVRCWHPHWAYRYKLACNVRTYADGVDWLMRRHGSDVTWTTVGA